MNNKMAAFIFSLALTNSAFGMSMLKSETLISAKNEFIATGPHEGWLLFTGALSMIGSAGMAGESWNQQNVLQKIGTSTVGIVGISFLIVSPFASRFTRLRYIGSPNHNSSSDEIKLTLADFERRHNAVSGQLIMSSVLSAMCLLFSESAYDREGIAAFAAIPLLALGLNYLDYRKQSSILKNGVELSFTPDMLWNGQDYIAGLNAHASW